MIAPCDVESVLERDGLVHLTGLTDGEVVEVLEALGEPIYVEEVKVSATSKSLVRSAEGIPWHTDHHRAKRIVWHGRAAAECGGETLVVDGLAALRELDDAHREALERVRWTEHRVFAGDRAEHPMVSARAGRTELYFSFWPAAVGETEALAAFREAVSRMPMHRFVLQRGDVLAIDNTRMLHARTAIGGDARHLRRYWLAKRKTARGAA